MTLGFLVGLLLAPGEPPAVVWTFDDGPYEATDKILPLLKRYGIKATFFVSGKQLVHAKNRARLRRVAAAGHVIANHLWSHASPCAAKVKRWRTLTRAQTLAELARTHRAMVRIVGAKRVTKLYRAPYGDWCHVAAIRAKGYTPMSWHVADLYTHKWSMWWAVRTRLRRGQRVIVLVHHQIDKLKFLLRKVYPKR